MPQRFYEEDEAEAILRIANKRSTLGGVSHDELLASAAELGISPEAVAEAAETYRSQLSLVESRKEFDRFAKREFVSSVATWLCLNAGLIAFNLISDHRITWAIWPLAGWGFFILAEIPETFVKGSKEYEKNYQKWLRKKAKREARLAEELAGGQPGA